MPFASVIVIGLLRAVAALDPTPAPAPDPAPEPEPAPGPDPGAEEGEAPLSSKTGWGVGWVGGR